MRIITENCNSVHDYADKFNHLFALIEYSTHWDICLISLYQ